MKHTKVTLKTIPVCPPDSAELGSYKQIRTDYRVTKIEGEITVRAISNEPVRAGDVITERQAERMASDYIVTVLA